MQLVLWEVGLACCFLAVQSQSWVVLQNNHFISTTCFVLLLPDCKLISHQSKSLTRLNLEVLLASPFCVYFWGKCLYVFLIAWHLQNCCYLHRESCSFHKKQNLVFFWVNVYSYNQILSSVSTSIFMWMSILILLFFYFFFRKLSSSVTFQYLAVDPNIEFKAIKSEVFALFISVAFCMKMYVFKFIL